VTRSILIVWTLVLIMVVTAVAVTGHMAYRARARAVAELARLRSVTEQAGQLSGLRAAMPAWALRRSPPAGLAERVGAALQAGGLPSSSLSGLSPTSESVVGGVGSTGSESVRPKVRRATLTLEPATLPQVGAFLEAWRTREPDWTVAGVDLSPLGSKAQSAGSVGEDLPLRAVFTLESLFVDDPGGSR
jgi:hypothetical protein